MVHKSSLILQAKRVEPGAISGAALVLQGPAVRLRHAPMQHGPCKVKEEDTGDV